MSGSATAKVLRYDTFQSWGYLLWRNFREMLSQSLPRIKKTNRQRIGTSCNATGHNLWLWYWLKHVRACSQTSLRYQELTSFLEPIGLTCSSNYFALGVWNAYHKVRVNFPQGNWIWYLPLLDDLMKTLVRMGFIKQWKLKPRSTSSIMISSAIKDKFIISPSSNITSSS